ncbi:hypothetical protein [Spiroplasma alleghenense]|uniref:Lipoprotein n=1 Tax=Spiroplasma alleghenense TaxID=216931 RepID=A0A345Z5B1_9MOLU|nr:hypothetical protein [Spiroplasma alleghenense]AXK51790.1 hypothetical protein SALLE_v1c11200 [Spiroplasma alleghenense]
MKKLLSILGATALVVSAPLSVASCKKKVIHNIDDEFDYQALKNELMDKASEVFYRNLNEDFGKCKNISNDEAKEIFTFISIDNLKNHEEDPELNNPDSQIFKSISNDVNSIVNFNKLNEDITEEIINQLNYRPLLQGIGNPFKSYELTNIAIKTQSEVVSLSFDYVANLEMVIDGKGEIQNETIAYKWTFNIFEKKDIAESIKALNENIRQEISNSANDFIYLQDSGNLKTNAQDIVDKKVIGNQVIEIIKKVNSENSNLKLVTDNHKFVVNQKLTQDGSIASTKINYGLEFQDDWSIYQEDSDGWFPQDYSYPKWWEELMGPVLKQEKGANEAFVSKITEPGQQWIDHQLPQTIKDKINKNSELVVSEAINHYNLAENIKSSDFQKRIQANNYDFEIDEVKDYKTIAVYGAEFSNSQVEIISSSQKNIVELDDFFVPIKQNTTFANTKKLYEEFLRASIEFQQSYLLNQAEGEIQYKNGEYVSWENWEKKHHYYVMDVKGDLEDHLVQGGDGKTYSYNEIIPQSINLKINQESDKNKAFIESSNFAVGKKSRFQSFTLLGIFGHPPDRSKFQITETMFVNPSEIVTYDYKAPEFRTYFFSSGLKFNSSKTYFSFGKREDFICSESVSNSDKTFAAKLFFNFEL